MNPLAIELTATGASRRQIDLRQVSIANLYQNLSVRRVAKPKVTCRCQVLYVQQPFQPLPERAILGLIHLDAV